MQLKVGFSTYLPKRKPRRFVTGIETATFGTSLTPENYIFTAIYGGDGAHEGNTSPSLTQTAMSAQH